MKQYLHFKTIVCCLFIGITIKSHAQQEFTLTTSPANITSAQALINLPELNGNPNAIILGIPQGNTATLNTHPLGVWYYTGRWYLFNTDFMPMLPGLTYKIQYFLSPGTNQFLHLVTQQNLGAEGSYIDNPALNNKPNVQLSIFQNHSPDIRAGSWRNPNEAKTGYNATSGRWYITNKNGQPLQKGCAYNIVVSQGGGTVIIENPGPIKTVPPATTTDCKCPASLPPSGQATGDLAGMYPNPMVTKLLNRPLSNTPPVIGQILKWNGTEWSPSNESGNAGNATTYTAGLGLSLTGTQFSTLSSTAMWNASQLTGRDIMTTAPTIGQVLKWGGGSWYPGDDNVGATGNAVAYSAAGGIQLTGTEFSALYETPMWNANKLLGRDMLTTAPTAGQVLKWGGGAWVPADDNVGAGGTGNGWNSNGNNISNTNTGNVGIGNNNPSYQLDISNRIRIRSGGNSSTTAGIWLNNNANNLAAFIGMEDDTHVGFYGMGVAGWKLSMNTQTGALKINGNEGTAGQVLTSNGAGSPPSWNQPPSTGAAGIKTYYKYPQNSQGLMETAGVAAETKIPSISGITITVTVPSTLAISASCYARANCPAVGSCPLSIEFYYKVNNNQCHPFGFSGAEYLTGTISNHFYDVAPGTYTIDFYSKKRSSYELNYSAAGGYATVMVLPK